MLVLPTKRSGRTVTGLDITQTTELHYATEIELCY